MWRYFWLGYGADVRLPWSTEKAIGHLFLHNPTVNIHILNSCSDLKDGYIYPSY